MSDLDEGRDVRAAFGTLLADEPASPWSASDDVARGRALQRRRRTRAGAGIGLVAAVVMVFGVFGPLRPQPTVVVPPAYQPPAVQGVDAAWIAALDRSFTAFNGPVVDWSRSTVTPTAGGGFSLDLTLVGATVTTGGENFTIEYPEPPGPPVARAFVAWKPAGGEGPVLASCAAPACERSDEGVSPTFAEVGGRWDGDSAQLAGTFVIDRTYDDGSMLELASAPHPDTEGGWSPVMNYGGIQFVLDRVGRPSDGSPLPSDDVYGMTALLDDLGWTVDGVTVQRVPQGQPTVVSWSASRPGQDGTTDTGILTVRAWDASSWKPGSSAIDEASALAGCDPAGACANVTRTLLDCARPDGCWSSASTTTKAAYTALPEGSYVLYTYNEVRQQAVEVVVEPLQCITCNARPLPPFLTPAETETVAARVQSALTTPTPSPTPTPSSDDAVTALLESYGFRVVSASPARTTSGGMSYVYTLDLDRTADNPRNGFLYLASYPASGVPIGATSIEVEGANISACTSTTCAPLQPITVPCPSTGCFQYWTTTTTSEYVGFDPGTRLMFRSDGGNGAEAMVGFSRCDTCTGDRTSSEPFLTVEQTEAVLNAFGYPVDSDPGEPCTNDQVKLVPAVDSAGGATGERSVAIEVYARNPSVSCTVRADPAAKLLVGGVPASGVTYGEGFFTPGEKPGSAVLVDSEHAAVFIIAKFRCDVGAVGRADGVDVRLPGSPTSTVVELPDSLGLELCGGGTSDAGNQVSVSVFIPREGGVG